MATATPRPPATREQVIELRLGHIFKCLSEAREQLDDLTRLHGPVCGCELCGAAAAAWEAQGNLFQWLNQ